LIVPHVPKALRVFASRKSHAEIKKIRLITFKRLKLSQDDMAGILPL